MAYTSVIPVHRLDRSIEYVKDKEKTTQKADSLEAAIDYAMNRTKTEQAVFEDTIGCTNENAYEDMLTTKRNVPKTAPSSGWYNSWPAMPTIRIMPTKYFRSMWA